MSDTGLLPRERWQLADWLSWLERAHPREIELGLERTREVATRLGLLHNVATTLTVAGTNGKGASAALAAEIYRTAGYRVGLYTSPHLLRYNERVVIDGVLATDDALCEAFRVVDGARGDISLTYFEFGTLAALWLFRRANVDVQVLEIGLGGRLDAVNVIDTDCALLTNIGLDHTAWLGPDRESIGREKAGIFRGGTPAVCVDREPPASVLSVATEMETDFKCLGEAFDYQLVGETWDWNGWEGAYRGLPRPGIPGDVQVRNAAGVLAAIESLQSVHQVPDAAIRLALPNLFMPGRFQRCGDLLLDVAHNAEAADCLAAHLGTLGAGTQLQLVIGMLADKPVEMVGRRLAPLFRSIYAAGLPESPRGLSGAALQTRLAAAGVVAECSENVSSAIAVARCRLPGAIIVVCGSFFSVSAALSQYECNHA